LLTGLRQKLKTIPIAVRLAVTVAVFLVVPTVVFATVLTVVFQRYAISNLSLHTERLARMLSQMVHVVMLEQNSKDLGEGFRMLTKSEDIRHMALTNHRSKRIVFSSTADEVGRRIEKSDTRCRICHSAAGNTGNEPKTAVILNRPAENVMIAVMPIYNEPGCARPQCHPRPQESRVLGVMELSVSTLNIRRDLMTHLAWMYALTLGIAAMSFMIVYLLSREVVGKPVNELVRATRNVAEGDFEHTIEPGEAEIGELAESFNRMLERLKATWQHLVSTERLASTGRLAADIAHELNNPLTGVLTFARHLLDESPPDDPRRPDLEIIVRETLRCRDIVWNLLDFSRSEKPSIERVDVNELLNLVIRFVRKQATFHDFLIETDLDRNLPLIQADPAQIQQVFLNLLLNAAEAMSSGGTITITTEAAGAAGNVVVSVKDTGPGIPGEHLRTIFEPHFSTKPGKRNKGLGLAVSLRIIEQHGGRIEVESPPKGGAVFRIILPITLPPEERNRIDRRANMLEN
jgi:two-component system NtrC family sensor kinase